jgi:hypothetical protein
LFIEHSPPFADYYEPHGTFQSYYKSLVHLNSSNACQA